MEGGRGGAGEEQVAGGVEYNTEAIELSEEGKSRSTVKAIRIVENLQINVNVFETTIVGCYRVLPTVRGQRECPRIRIPKKKPRGPGKSKRLLTHEPGLGEVSARIYTRHQREVEVVRRGATNAGSSGRGGQKLNCERYKVGGRKKRTGENRSPDGREQRNKRALRNALYEERTR